jgi:hypothetical protein
MTKPPFKIGGAYSKDRQIELAAIGLQASARHFVASAGDKLSFRE